MADVRTDLMSLPGKEARYEWDGNAFLLNDAQGALPRVKWTSIEGQHSRADMEDVRDPNTGKIGETARDTLLRGRTIIYHGDPGKGGGLQAATQESLRYRAGLLRQMFAPADERTMRIIPHPTYGGNTYKYKGRILLADIDEDDVFSPGRVPSPWLRQVTLSIRQSDPRYYLDEALRLSASATYAAGGEIALAITNDGSAFADPILRIYGPINGPRIRRVVVGQDAVFPYPAMIDLSGMNLAVGQRIDIDFTARTIVRDNGTDLTPNLLPQNSTWWDALVEGFPAGVATTFKLWSAPNTGWLVGTTKFDVQWARSIW